jgi:hypothetical protein
MGRYDLVTFSFGGDDIGFASIVQSCYEHTSECSNGTVRSGISTLGRAFPGFLIRVARSAVVSGGNVVVMGYPELIEDPSLWPQINRDTHQCQGIDTNTSKSIRGWAGALNAAIGSAVDRVNARPAAERNGVHFTFVDVVTGQSSDGISRSNPDLFEPATGARHELCSQGPCPKLSVGGIPASQERGTRRDNRDGGPWQMMVDGAEERQLKARSTFWRPTVPTYLRSKSGERRAIVVDEATCGLSIVGTLPASRKE